MCSAGAAELPSSSPADPAHVLPLPEPDGLPAVLYARGKEPVDAEANPSEPQQRAEGGPVLHPDRDARIPAWAHVHPRPPRAPVGGLAGRRGGAPWAPALPRVPSRPDPHGGVRREVTQATRSTASSRVPAARSSTAAWHTFTTSRNIVLLKAPRRRGKLRAIPRPTPPTPRYRAAPAAGRPRKSHDLAGPTLVAWR